MGTLFFLIVKFSAITFLLSLANLFTPWTEPISPPRDLNDLQEVKAVQLAIIMDEFVVGLTL